MTPSQAQFCYFVTKFAPELCSFIGPDAADSFWVGLKVAKRSSNCSDLSDITESIFKVKHTE